MASGPQTTQIDPNTKRLMEEQRKRLMQDSTESLLQGVGTPGQGLMSQQPAYDYSAGLGGDSAQMGKRVTDAISSRNNARSGDYISRLKRELALTAPARDAAKLRTARTSLQGESDVAVHNEKILKQFDLDKRRVEQYKQQQKDSVLASIIGVAAAVAGTALAVVTGGAAAPLAAAGIAGAAKMAGNNSDQSGTA